MPLIINNGYNKTSESLLSNVKRAKQNGNQLPHTLFQLSNLMAKDKARQMGWEMGVNIKFVSALDITLPGDLAGLLTNLEENAILFIESVHLLDELVLNYLYQAMDDLTIDIFIDPDSPRSVQIKLNPFTIISAIENNELLPKALKKRFKYFN